MLDPSMATDMASSFAPKSTVVLPSPLKVVSRAPAEVSLAIAKLRALLPAPELEVPTTTILPLASIATSCASSVTEKSIVTNPSPPPKVLSVDPYLFSRATKKSASAPVNLPASTTLPSLCTTVALTISLLLPARSTTACRRC
jgi:hypothetical protein